MFDAYTLLKFGHVMLAIVAVGFNASYGIWIARASKNPVHEPHVLRTIKVLDDRFANPAYALLLVTGVAMVLLSPAVDFEMLWIAASLVLYGVVVLVALLGYTPTLRRQIQVLEDEGGDSATYRSLAARGRLLGIVLALLVVAIVFLMVTKPTL